MSVGAAPRRRTAVDPTDAASATRRERGRPTGNGRTAPLPDDFESRPAPTFVGVDGEAQGDRYVLLAASTGQELYDRRGIASEDAFQWLIDVSSRDHVLVGFSIDYDVNMILRDVPWDAVEWLYENGSVIWRGWRIAYYPRRLLSITRGNRRAVLYDVWPFFGVSFIASCEQHGIPLRKIVAKGKAARGTFASWRLSDLRAYNAAELEALVKLITKLARSLTSLRITPRAWYGPGALADAWLTKVLANRVSMLKDPTAFPRAALERAYFGGRIDAGGWGTAAPVWRIDIRSAYPHASTDLPDLRSISWQKQRTYRSGSLALVHVRWAIPPETRWGPLPWRDARGSILWPHEGEGWYWSPEVDAARRRFGATRVRVVEAWVAKGPMTYPLDEPVRDLYLERERMKRKDDPAEFAAKLVLNSIYGKFAQAVGAARFHSMCWAGIITATCRGRLNDAIAVLGDDHVLAVATDGIITDRKPPRSLGGNGLGSWEVTPFDRLIMLEAGVYELEGEHSYRYTRGLERGTPLDLDAIARYWREGGKAPRTSAKVTRFIGIGLARQTHWPWRTWVTIERHVEPVPLMGTSKRMPSLDRIDGDWTWTDPTPRDEDRLSYPYVPHRIDDKWAAFLAAEEVGER